MSDHTLNRLRNKVFEAVEEEESAAQKFFSKFAAEKKAVLLADILGMDEAENWSRQEIESYFSRNAESLFDEAINEKEIRDFLGVDQETLIKISEEGEETLDELVNSDGTLVGGNRTSDRPTANNDSQIKTAPQQTTNDYAAGAVQPRSMFRGGMGGAYSHGSAAGMGESVNKNNGKIIKEKEVREMVEDILDKKTDKEDLVKDRSQPDINRNQIPDITELFRDEDKGSVATRTDELIQSINENGLNGDEMSMVLNAILTKVETEDEIPYDFKKQLKKKL